MKKLKHATYIDTLDSGIIGLVTIKNTEKLKQVIELSKGLAEAHDMASVTFRADEYIKFATIEEVRDEHYLCDEDGEIESFNISAIEREAEEVHSSLLTILPNGGVYVKWYNWNGAPFQTEAILELNDELEFY